MKRLVGRPKGEGTNRKRTDVKTRRLEEQTRLETWVVLAVNDEYKILWKLKRKGK